MSTGTYKPGEKRERARKFHVTDKVGGNPYVINAFCQTDAVSSWARRTGLSAREAVVTPIGSHGVAATSKAEAAKKPAARKSAARNTPKKECSAAPAASSDADAAESDADI